MPIQKFLPAHCRCAAVLATGTILVVTLCGIACAGPDGFELRGPVDALPLASAHTAQAAATALPWKTILLIGHLLGVALGFGAALFLDFYLLRHLYWQPVSRLTLELIEFGERLVAVGLAVLWLSGLGFLLLCYLDTPEKLANPKLWSKVAIVCALSVNGFAIRAIVRPRVEARIGRPLLTSASLGQAMPLLFVAALSATSWFTAFVLGIVRELNFVVPATSILSAYCAALASAVLAASALHAVFRQSATNAGANRGV